MKPCCVHHTVDVSPVATSAVPRGTGVISMMLMRREGSLVRQTFAPLSVRQGVPQVAWSKVSTLALKQSGRMMS
jgi:hypothetical protein